MGRPAPEDRLNLEWLLVALRRRYRGGERLSAELLAGGAPYAIRLDPERAEIQRGSASSPDVRLAADEPLRLAELFLRGWPADGAPQGVRIDGDAGRARALVEAFERTD
jgi:hypothetical protein